MRKKAKKSLFCKSVRHFVVKMSFRRAFLVRRFVNGSAIFRRRYGHFCQLKVRPFSKTGQHFVYKRYYRSKSNSKAVRRANYGDGRTVVL